MYPDQQYQLASEVRQIKIEKDNYIITADQAFDKLLDVILELIEALPTKHDPMEE